MFRKANKKMRIRGAHRLKDQVKDKIKMDSKSEWKTAETRF